jgi:hypothetical protein
MTQTYPSWIDELAFRAASEFTDQYEKKPNMSRPACGGNTSTIANALGGGGVYLLSGTQASPCTYGWAGHVTMGSNQMLLGAGQAATIIDGGGTDDGRNF